MALSATNIEKAKLVNLWVVFDAVRRHGPLSRADIARHTGLSKQTVSNLADELYGAGLLRADGRKGGTVGKPSVQLRLNEEGGYAIGLQLDRGRLAGVCIDLTGQVRAKQAGPLLVRTPEQAVLALANTVDVLRAAMPASPDALLGVGLVMPGPFNVEAIGPTSLPGWNGLALADALEREIGHPVLLENDATAAATAEWLFGSARHFETFAYLFIGLGLGGGLIAEGRAIAGAAGNAGEFGHMIVRPGGLSCSCGNKGCFERYVSLQSLLDRFGAATSEEASADELMEKLSPADPQVQAWLDDAIEPLRIGVNIIENAFDPETIVIGGDVPSWLAELLIAQSAPLYPSIGMKAPRQVPRLTLATAGRDAAARGAAVLPMFGALDPSYRPLRREGAKSAPLRPRLRDA